MNEAEKMENYSIVLFDGVCNLCNASINFIIRHDKKNHFRFAPLQSNIAKELLQQYTSNPEKIDTVVLIEKKRLYKRSTAALRIFRRLSGLWKLMYAFIIVPAFIRNAVYNFISKKRYRWFGKRATCMVPTPEVSGKFLQ